jgi:hypothetical protein
MEPSQMKIGLVVTEPVDSDELERKHGGMRGVQDVDFDEEDGGDVRRRMTRSQSRRELRRKI